MELVGTYFQDWEAHMAVDELANNGIKAVINNEIISTVYPIGAMGGIQVFVRDEDAEKARDILKSTHM